MNSKDLKDDLMRVTRLSENILEAAWPEWWSENAEDSPSAQAELRFSLARKLGLDPTSLLDDEQPEFVWEESSKYKNFRGDQESEKPALSAFGISTANLLFQCVSGKQDNPIESYSAGYLREAILSVNKFVGVPELLTFLWGISIPVIHLRLYPLAAKRMCAMAVKHRDSFAILLAYDSKYPASTAFHLAHEIGHIVLGHLEGSMALVDMEDPADVNIDEQDQEELAADRFALELLTGFPETPIEVIGTGKSASNLAKEAMAAAEKWRIEPGTIALCYGYRTGNWDVANGAIKRIYSEPRDVWKVVNGLARSQLDFDRLPEDSQNFLGAVIGAQ